MDENSAIDAYFQLGQLDASSSTHLMNKACFDYVAFVVRDPFFNQLRTVEGLGYVVRAVSLQASDVVGLYFQVQSAQNPDYLMTRIQAFLTSFASSLIPGEDFAAQVQVIAQTKTQAPLTLQEEAALFWREIVWQKYVFNRAQLEATALLTLTPDVVSQFYQTFILGGLYSQVFAGQEIPIPKPEAGTMFLNDVSDFHSLVTHYPT